MICLRSDYAKMIGADPVAGEPGRLLYWTGDDPSGRWSLHAHERVKFAQRDAADGVLRYVCPRLPKWPSEGPHVSAHRFVPLPIEYETHGAS
jgi:hypothetical protein